MFNKTTGLKYALSSRGLAWDGCYRSSKSLPNVFGFRLLLGGSLLRLSSRSLWFCLRASPWLPLSSYQPVSTSFAVVGIHNMGYAFNFKTIGVSKTGFAICLIYVCVGGVYSLLNFQIIFQIFLGWSWVYPDWAILGV